MNFFCVFLGFVSPLYAESLDEPTLGITTLWESKYVSEGRDNLNNGGVFSFEAALEFQDLTAGACFAAGDRETYEELNLFVEYGFEFDPVAASIGYSRLEFLEDNESDNEISLGIAVNGIPSVVPALNYTYSDKAAGGFLEFSLRSEIELLNDQLILEPYILEGFDFGYASDEYDGANNFQIGIDFTSAFFNPINIVGSFAHSWAQEDVKNDGLGDVSWFTIGFSVVL